MGGIISYLLFGNGKRRGGSDSSFDFFDGITNFFREADRQANELNLKIQKKEHDLAVEKRKIADAEEREKKEFEEWELEKQERLLHVKNCYEFVYSYDYIRLHYLTLLKVTGNAYLFYFPDLDKEIWLPEICTELYDTCIQNQDSINLDCLPRANTAIKIYNKDGYKYITPVIVKMKSMGWVEPE